MKQHLGLTVDAKLLKEIETLRGREKRSTFIEHLLRLGLKAYVKSEDLNSAGLRKNKDQAFEFDAVPDVPL